VSGFTLYETLRIFLPGALGVFVLDLVLRFAFGVDVAAPDGGVWAVVNGIQSPVVGVFVAVFIGLALYLLDIPTKSRLYREGDPPRGIQQPSAALADSLKPTPLSEFPKNLSLYFLLSDRYLPDELHKRIYLFGSLYRVYVDMRVLLAFGTVGGVAVGLAVASGHPGFDPSLLIGLTSALFVVVLVLAMVASGSSGIFAYAHNVRAKRGTGEVSKRLGDEAKRISLCCVVLFALGLFAILLLASGEGVLAALGAVLALGCLTLWSWIEIGPPGGLGRTDLRSIVLLRLKAGVGAVQYEPLERLLTDVSLFLPWLIGAAVLYRNLGPSPSALLCWGILILPCTAIMGIRKHEQRLLSTYGDQTLWLELHASEIADIRKTGRLPDKWD
jgi:hypothetical protein